MGRKYKGQANKTAMMLFGNRYGRKMEKPEDRKMMAAALAHSTDIKMRTLAGQAVDPIYKSYSFATLVENMGLTYEHVAKEFHQLMKIEGMTRQSKMLPGLMEETAQNAQNKTYPCADCDGTGQVPGRPAYKLGKSGEGEVRGTKLCKTCHGEGKVTIRGDIDCLKLVFETFQLTGKSGQPMVNLDLRTIKPHESMADLSASIAPILNGEVITEGEPT
jgi:hypothetical protein